jgi:hypothetical protein
MSIKPRKQKQSNPHVRVQSRGPLQTGAPSDHRRYSPCLWQWDNSSFHPGGNRIIRTFPHFLQAWSLPVCTLQGAVYGDRLAPTRQKRWS